MSEDAKPIHPRVKANFSCNCEQCMATQFLVSSAITEHEGETCVDSGQLAASVLAVVMQIANMSAPADRIRTITDIQRRITLFTLQMITDMAAPASGDEAAPDETKH